jgi:hypothetical protein
VAFVVSIAGVALGVFRALARCRCSARVKMKNGNAMATISTVAPIE